MSKNQEPHAANIKSPREIIGGCHCQAVRFKANIAPDAVVLRCNCSICSMTGFKHLIVKHQDFVLLLGQANLTNYTFNTCNAKHLFCSICGVKSFYQPRSHAGSWSINTNCIDQFNPAEWTEQDFNGKNWQQAKIDLSKIDSIQD